MKNLYKVEEKNRVCAVLKKLLKAWAGITENGFLSLLNLIYKLNFKNSKFELNEKFYI